MRFRGRVRPSAAVMLLAAGLSGCTTPSSRSPSRASPCPKLGGNRAAPATLDLAAYWRMLDDPLLTEFVEAAAGQQSRPRAERRPARAGAGAASRAPARASCRRFGQRARLARCRRLRAGRTEVLARRRRELGGRPVRPHRRGRRGVARPTSAAGYSLADLQRLITGQVALSTIQARATAVQLAIARDTLAYQDENLQIARWRVQAGLVSSLDVEQARSQRAQTAASIPLLESNLAATANAISTLIGEPPGRVLRVARGLGGVPDPPVLAAFEAPAEVCAAVPTCARPRPTLLSSTARIKGARAQLLPRSGSRARSTPPRSASAACST